MMIFSPPGAPVRVECLDDVDHQPEHAADAPEDAAVEQHPAERRADHVEHEVDHQEEDEPVAVARDQVTEGEAGEEASTSARICRTSELTPPPIQRREVDREAAAGRPSSAAPSEGMAGSWISTASASGDLRDCGVRQRDRGAGRVGAADRAVADDECSEHGFLQNFVQCSVSRGSAARGRVIAENESWRCWSSHPRFP